MTMSPTASFCLNKIFANNRRVTDARCDGDTYGIIDIVGPFSAGRVESVELLQINSKSGFVDKESPRSTKAV